MLTKAVSGMMLALLLACVLTFAFNIQPAKSPYTPKGANKGEVAVKNR